MPYHTDKKDNKPKSKDSKPKKPVKMQKPVMKPKKDLSPRQKALMKEHKVHHTKEHMSMMRKLMKEGFCFEQAHEMTMKKIGK